MTWQEMLKRARSLAQEAKAIYVEDEGDTAKADDLLAQADDLKDRADKIKKAEGFDFSEEPETEPVEGFEKRQFANIRKELTSGGYSEDVVNAMLKSLDSNGVDINYAEKGQDEGEKSLGDWLKCVRFADKSAQARNRLSSVYGSRREAGVFKGAFKDLEESTGASGGYLVPTEQLTELLQVPESKAVVRPRARVIPMSRRSLNVPMLDQDGTPAAYWKLQYYGGVLSYWTEEVGTKTETEPAFKQLELVAHKLAGYTQASDELLEDSSVGIEPMLVSMFRGAINMREDFGFLRGSGVGQPLGILNSGVLLTQNRATANSIEYRDLARMMDDFLPSSYSNATWVVTHTALPQLLQMEDGAGNNVFIPNASGGIAQSMPGSILGRPVIVTEKTPSIGSTGDVMLCDFSYYVIGDRRVTAIDSSEHYAFINDRMTWRFVHRVDGQPWLDAPIYIDTSNQVSPFVALHANTTS